MEVAISWCVRKSNAKVDSKNKPTYVGKVTLMLRGGIIYTHTYISAQLCTSAKTYYFNGLAKKLNKYTLKLFLVCLHKGMSFLIRQAYVDERK